MISFFKKSDKASPDVYRKLEGEFRKFLLEQIELPETEWQEEFEKYLKQKVKEKDEIKRQLQRKIERSEKEVREQEFQRYLKGLDLEIKNLRRKRILDLGCGEGNFVKECLRRGITDQIYGLDIRLDFREIEKEYQGYFIRSDFEKDLPLSNLDLIISVGALEAREEGSELRKPAQTIKWALGALRPSGEIRIYPIYRVSPAGGPKGIEQARYQWAKVFEELNRQGGIEWQLRPVDIWVTGEKPDIWLEEVLIIKRNPSFKAKVV